jgi:hypothetical protein
MLCTRRRRQRFLFAYFLFSQRESKLINPQRCAGFDVRHEAFVSKLDRVIDLA